MLTVKKRPETSRVSFDLNSPSVRKLDEAFARRRGEALGFLFFLTESLETAQDALAIARERCHANTQLEEITNFNALIFRVMYSVCVDLTRGGRAKRRKGVDVHEQLENVLASRWERLTEQRRDATQIACRRIISLPFQSRAVFLLKLNGELTYSQIAQIVHLSQIDVMSLMKEALAVVFVEESFKESEALAPVASTVEDSTQNASATSSEDAVQASSVKE